MWFVLYTEGSKRGLLLLQPYLTRLIIEKIKCKMLSKIDNYFKQTALNIFLPAYNWKSLITVSLSPPKFP